MYAQHSAGFLRAIAMLTMVAFAVPITFAPFGWARLLRWTVGQHTDLALYFGRCLGAVALVLVFAAWLAAGNPAVQPFFFGIMIGNFTLLTLVHVVGALQKKQPWTETAEIPFWAGLALLGLLFYPG